MNPFQSAVLWLTIAAGALAVAGIVAGFIQPGTRRPTGWYKAAALAGLAGLFAAFLWWVAS